MAPVARFGALLLLISCSFASALYDAKSPILQVTDADYKSKLKGFALLELYAPCVPLRRCCGSRRNPILDSSVHGLTHALAGGAGTASSWRPSGRSSARR